MRFVRRQAAREDGCNMKRIKLEICNGLMAAAITRMLEHTEGFSVIRGASLPADVLLMETAYDPGFTLGECLTKAKLLRSRSPECKVILLCDENSAPELARQVVQAKKDGRIDDFVYSSVSESYLTALLSAL